MAQVTCPYCPKKFSESRYLWAHKDRLHKEKLQKERKDNLAKEERRKATHKFSCSECSWTGPSVRRRNAHFKAKHNHLVLSEAAHSHVCTECKAEFSTMGPLREHYDEMHGKKIQEKDFSNWNNFKAWKRDLEMSKCISFVKNNGSHKRKSGEIVSSFCCSNSGQHFGPMGTGKKPNRPSKRVGYPCTVFLVARTAMDGSVKIHYCDSHNHEPMPQTLPLPFNVKQSVANMLRKGLQTKQILDRVRRQLADTNDSRLCLITASDIRNIRASPRLFPQVDAQQDTGADSAAIASCSHNMITNMDDSRAVKIVTCQKLIETVSANLPNASEETLSAAVEVLKNCERLVTGKQLVQVRQIEPRPNVPSDALPRKIRMIRVQRQQPADTKRQREAEND